MWKPEKGAQLKKQNSIPKTKVNFVKMEKER